jgi:hypothetical protein
MFLPSYYAAPFNRRRSSGATRGNSLCQLTNRHLKEASNEGMLAGKRCSPVLIYVFIAVIIGALTFLAVSHGPDRQPKAEPIHEKQ